MPSLHSWGVTYSFGDGHCKASVKPCLLYLSASWALLTFDVIYLSNSDCHFQYTCPCHSCHLFTETTSDETIGARYVKFAAFLVAICTPVIVGTATAHVHYPIIIEYFHIVIIF